MSLSPSSVFKRKTGLSSGRVRQGLSLTGLVLVLSVAFVGVFSLRSQTTLAIRTQCSDGVDNDGNGLVDYPQDPGCMSIDDEYEGTTLSGDFVTITDERETVAPNGSLVYIITLKQQREIARNVNVTLSLPHQTNIASASDGGSVGPDTVRWTNVSVYKNVTRTLTVNVHVRPDAVPGQYLVARVRVDGSEATDTTLVQEYTAQPSDKLILFLTDDHESIAPAQVDTYTLTVRNNGTQSQKRDVNLALPYDTEFLSASDNGRRSSYTVTWPNITVNPGELRTFRATVLVDRNPSENLMRAKAFVGSAVAIDQTIVSTGLPAHSISATISADRESAQPGDILTYTVHVTNDSDMVATNVSVDASLPTYGLFQTVDQGGFWDGGNVRWLFLQIAPHDSRTVHFSVLVRSDAPDGVGLRASVFAGGSAGVLTSMRIARTVGGADDRDNRVLFRKTADRGEAMPGGKIRYTLFVRNTLNHLISDATILDRFDTQYLSLVSAERSQSLVSQSDGQMLWQVPVLAPGESWETSYVLSVARDAPSGIALENVALLRGTDLQGVSLTETVQTNRSGVMQDFPTTGAGMDTMLAGLLALMALATSGVQRKIICE